ncbi:methyltransferase domain-containing protein [Streptomyces gobiensis]|uniref:methyltransferase domain-containing protein n=1 Tax=Streptomyces gobiensis TaxID=2875706 RepID=UPI0030CA78EA
MLRHARLYEGARVLDVGTGSGYSSALLARRFGSASVASIDVDPYLTEAAKKRLAAIGLRPPITTCDATGPLPGAYDRIVSMVSVRPIPASWLAALKPGGRLVTTIASTSLIVTATKTDDGSAVGRIERDWAGFMTTRSGSDYPPSLRDQFNVVRNREGEDISRGRYPVLNLTEAWELRSMFEVMAPGVEAHYEERGRIRTAWLLHSDGSWAQARALWIDPPEVHQGGPRRLWDILERIRHRLNAEGGLPLYGSRVTITPEGVCHLQRGNWTATIGQ